MIRHRYGAFCVILRPLLLLTSLMNADRVDRTAFCCAINITIGRIVRVRAIVPGKDGGMMMAISRLSSPQVSLPRCKWLKRDSRIALSMFLFLRYRLYARFK
uniref:Putative secreted protein n=1 Tax=Anopheles darlingi TaxID=43151 RepID=A0A2M4DCI7_ANODA